MTDYSKPLPKRGQLTDPFWDHAQNHQLAVQRCNDCGDCHFPPSPVCPACLSRNQGWHVCSGRATLDSWVEVHRAYWPAFAADLPYKVCMARLEEGPVLVSNLVGADDRDLKVGAPLMVVFEAVTETVTLHRFQLAGTPETEGR
jgi:uncharacterized protein